jgi:predicted Zn-dependent protease
MVCNEKNPLVSFLVQFLCILFVMTACASRPAKPDETKELPYLSEKDEIKFGNYVDAVVKSQYSVVKDEHLTEQVAVIGNQLAAVSARPNLSYTFAVLNTSEVNAFAGPGGFVYVTVGLLDKLKSKDELATVLAHEVGHVCERHSVRSYYNAQKMQNVLTLVDVAAMVAGVPPVASLGGDMVGDFSKIVANLTAAIIAQGYSRNWENKADELGFSYASRADYDPHAFVIVLERFRAMEKEKGEETKITLLSSHPKTEDRIAHIKSLLGEDANHETGNEPAQH